MGVREARLLPEWADLYSGITPDLWYVAAELVPLVLRHRLEDRSTWEFAERIMIDGHFEFRGRAGIQIGPRYPYPTLGEAFGGADADARKTGHACTPRCSLWREVPAAGIPPLDLPR